MAGTRVKMKPPVSEDGKVAIKFDIETLDLLIDYVLQEKLDKSQIRNLHTLMHSLNMDAYQYTPDKLERILLITVLSDARMQNISNINALRLYASDKDEHVKKLLDSLNWNNIKMSPQDIRFVGSKVSAYVQNLYVFMVKDRIIETLEKFEDVDYTSYHDVVGELRREITQLLAKIHEADISERVLRSFNFASDEFREKIEQVVSKAKEPAMMLQTGMRQLNAILSGGFYGTRLYTFLGLSGRFKSGTLLNLADQIRKFNPQLVHREDGIRNVILFVTCENTIEETIERLFDMYASESEQLRSLSVEEVIDIIQMKGNYTFTESDGIDIEFRFYSDMEITTGDLVALVQSQEDIGRHPIALILDYLALVDCVQPIKSGDERSRLKFVTKELKNLAVMFQIPVITAQQVNREGNTTIDAAMRDNKEDLARFLGSGNVAECWDIVAKSDWMCLLNIEARKSTNQMYLTFKLTKYRGKRDHLAVDYFNQPFANEKNIRLMTDVDLPYSVAVISLKTDLESIDMKALEEMKSPQSRPGLSSVKSRKVENMAQLRAVG